MKARNVRQACLLLLSTGLYVVVAAAGCGEDRGPRGENPTTPAVTTATGVGGGGGTGGAASSSTASSSMASSTAATGGMGGGLPGHCSNNMMDGNESDVDCGGSCDPCADGEMCGQPNDCNSGVCTNGTCAVSTCVDMVHNGQETDVDCGGPNCGPCGDLKMCTDDSHCTSNRCVMNVCQVATCGDMVQNGNETDVDCGGSCTGKCLVGQGCMMGTDCEANICSSNICQCPAEMDITPTLGGGAYCIDRQEVDYTQYEVFWLANPMPMNQIAACQWNPDYTPELSWPASQQNKSKPVVGVNWCEAYAYCAWAGKRLCEKIGGGDNGYGDYANAMLSEWFNACSAQGNNTYPYGSTYLPSACNGLDAGNAGTVATGSQTTCLGGSLNLLDMSGNVREWVNTCDATTGATDNCRLRGGSYQSSSQALTCAAADSGTRNQAALDIGFRCCL